MIAVLLSLVPDARSQLTVVTPPELKAALGTVPFAVANFGHIPYGRKMVGVVVVASPPENCQLEAQLKANRSKLDKFVLMRRGGCSFVSKALNAQEEDAKLAIVYDDLEEDSASIAMVDDGHGHLVTIPTVIIPHAQGAVLAEYAESHPDSPISLALNFQTHLAPKVDLVFFLSNSDRHSAILLRDFNPFLKTLGKLATFKPVWETHACPECVPEDCVQGHRFCTFPEVGSKDTGRQVILQMLRQHFVFRQHPSIWFSYMDNYDLYCDSFAAAQHCSDVQLERLGLKPKEIQEIDAQATAELQRTDGVLSHWRLLRVRAGVVLVPDVVVNNVTYHGEMLAPDVFELACNSLTAPPAACNPFLNDPSRVVPELDHKAMIALVVLAVSVCLALMGFCVFCVYRRFLRRRLSQDIGGQLNVLVSQYIELEEEKH